MASPWLVLLAVLVYGLVHSFLASLWTKARARRWFGAVADRTYRLFYNVFAVVSFLPVLGAGWPAARPTAIYDPFSVGIDHIPGTDNSRGCAVAWTFSDRCLVVSGFQAAGTAHRSRPASHPGDQGIVPLGAPPALHGGAGLYLVDAGDDCQFAGNERWLDDLHRRGGAVRGAQAAARIWSGLYRLSQEHSDAGARARVET